MKFILTVVVFFIVFICSVKASVPTLDHRIVGGKNATILEFPYQVSLRKLNIHICGGSVFHNSYILTAAHCVHGGITSQYSIRVGSNFANKGGKRIKICGIVVNGNYNVDTLDNDIAILKLCSPLTFSDRILPVALPEVGEALAVGSRALVSGWGYEMENGILPSTLKQVEVPIIPQKECKKAYKQYADVTGNMICAGLLQSGGKDACQGDSGGPLRANGKLMGIISWGFGCARPSYPGVYTKVSNYRNWIKQVANY